MSRTISNSGRQQQSVVHNQRIVAAAILVRAALICICGIICGTSAIAAPQEKAAAHEQTFLAALRARQMFQLAEIHCMRQLDRPELTPAERSVFLLEYSRTLALHANRATGDEQADLWDRADEVLRSALVDSPEIPQRAYLMAQRAFVMANRAKSQRLQRAIDSRIPRESIRTLVTTAVNELKLLQNEYQNSKQADLKDLTSAEKRQLRKGLDFMLAEMLVENAQTWSPEDPDFAELLLAANRILQTLATRPSTTEIAWRARILQAATERMRDDVAMAKRLLKNIVEDDPPAEFLQQAVAEQMRCALQQDKPGAAATLAVELRKQHKNLSPSAEVLFLKLRAVNGLREQAFDLKDQPLVEKLAKQRSSVVNELELRHGGYWTVRAKTFLKLAAESTSFGPDVAKLIARAREDFAVGNYSGAIQGYQQAAQRTRETGRNELASEFAFTGASIALEQKDYAAAAQAFKKLSSTWPDSPRAERSHLLWAWCLGRIYFARRTAANRKNYTAALEQHRVKFSDRDSVHEANWLLAEFQEQRLQYTQAVTFYESIPTTHTRGIEAQLGIVRCYQRISERLSTINLSAAQRSLWESRAYKAALAAYRAVLDLDATALDKARVQNGLAEILLRQTAPEFETVEKLLVATLNLYDNELKKPAPVTPDEQARRERERTQWQIISKDIPRLQILSAAGSGNFSLARKSLDALISQIKDSGKSSGKNSDTRDLQASVSVWLNPLLRLSTSNAADNQSSSNNMSAPLVALKLRALDAIIKLPANSNSATWLNELKAHRVTLMAQSGRVFEAIEEYENRLNSNPKDVTALQDYAQLLETAGGTQRISTARQLWQRVEKLSPPGSAEWCRARLEIARLSLQIGQSEACLKLIRVTRLLYPTLGNAQIARQYDALEKLATKASTKPKE